MDKLTLGMVDKSIHSGTSKYIQAIPKNNKVYEWQRVAR